jgi:ATP-dependent helicase Lhr and Lhr-like helicase
MDCEGMTLPWRELLRAFRRLEARGEIRDGRFAAGVSGEQFALNEAVSALRSVWWKEPDGALISAPAADPLNLVGIVLPGARVPVIPTNRILYRDGVLITVLESKPGTLYISTLESVHQFNLFIDSDLWCM